MKTKFAILFLFLAAAFVHVFGQNDTTMTAKKMLCSVLIVEVERTYFDGQSDFSRHLAGRISGLSLREVSGTFGVEPQMLLRGASSMLGNLRPLVVIDGFVQENMLEFPTAELLSGNASTLLSSTFAGLNAEDIDYIQVFKDGSATTLYGSRGSAGVISIVTKKGVYRINKKLTITYYGDLSFRLKPTYRQADVLNSQEQMKIYEQMTAKGWLGTATTVASEYGVYGKMYELIRTYDPTTNTFLLPNTQQATHDYLQQAEFRNTDWFDALFQNSIFQNHSLSISGGSKMARYYTSVSAMLDPGWTVKSGVNRFTVNSKADFDLLRNLKLDLHLNASTRKQQAAGTSDSYVDVVYGKTLRNFENNPYKYATTASRTMDKNEIYRRHYANFNILQELENNYIDLRVSDIAFNGGLEWKPLRSLALNGTANVRYYSATMEHNITENSNMANAFRAGVIPEGYNYPLLVINPNDPQGIPQTILPVGGIYLNNNLKMWQSNFRVTADYAQEFDNKHIINIFAGAEYNLADRKQNTLEGWGYSFTSNKPTKIDPDNYDRGSISKLSYQNLGFFANAVYSFSEKYTLSLTSRIDNDNYIAAEWLPSYSVGASWDLHKEKFLRDFHSISMAKIRAAYSFVAGSSPLFQWNATPFNLNNFNAYVINNNLTYEKKREYNVGFNLGLLDNKLYITSDFFLRNNYDLIDVVLTQGIGGAYWKYTNNANILTKGAELSLATINNQSRDFRWRTNFTFTFIDNKITKLTMPATLFSLVSGNAYGVENYPVGALFSFDFSGLNNEGIPTFKNYSADEIYFQRYDSETVKTLKYEGSTIPNLYGGFENEFLFKNFTFNAFLTYSFGNKIRLNPIFSTVYSDAVAHSSDFRNMWVLPDDETLTNIPTIVNVRQFYDNATLANVYTAYNYSTERIANGSFVRLKELSLTYDFDKKTEKLLKIKSLRLKLMATNLCLLYSDKKLHGQDPEFVNSGGVALPVPQQFTFSVRAEI